MRAALAGLLALVAAAGRASVKPEMAALCLQAHAIAEQLRGAAGEEEDEAFAEVSNRLQERLAALKSDASLDPRWRPALEKLDDAVAAFPDRDYARKYPRDLAYALARQVELSAARASTPEQLSADLESKLELPSDLALLPKNMSLERFKQLGAVVVWLLKHRPDAPDDFRAVDPERMKAGAYPVAVGVTLRGRVAEADSSPDQDYSFDVGIISAEITPEMRIRRKLAEPKVGDLVEIQGWSYYDMFHEDETVGEPGRGPKRPTVWEVHPVLKVTVLERAKR